MSSLLFYQWFMQIVLHFGWAIYVSIIWSTIVHLGSIFVLFCLYYSMQVLVNSLMTRIKSKHLTNIFPQLISENPIFKISKHSSRNKLHKEWIIKHNVLTWFPLDSLLNPKKISRKELKYSRATKNILKKKTIFVILQVLKNNGQILC